METETVRELLSRAHSLYDDGEWNASLEILENQEIIKRASFKEIREAAVLAGFNYWKKGEKEKAFLLWINVTGRVFEGWTRIEVASAHAGLGMYYAERDEKGMALEHARLAQDLLPEDATLNHVMHLNSCGITMAKIGELERAEEILKKVAKINEQLEKSDDPVIARKAKHQRAKNGYNLVSLILILQRRWDEAFSELELEVIPRYQNVGAETDEAAAWHRMSEIAESTGDLYVAYAHEKKSLYLWERHQKNAPGRVKMALENIREIEAKMREQE
ncbi:MAG: hypothetical protein U9P70_05420 [Patescibacteria group bacterium]|nr:hypothetical protein [Patescibacteria group bacterium]